MRIQTFSIVAGTEACNARCPFCVSKMTVENGIGLKEQAVDWRNFEKACLLARQAGTTTAMITSKGEPTLFPDQITDYLLHLEPHRFPFIELQTNGIPIANGKVPADTLQTWYKLGLTTVAISVVHYAPDVNRRIYMPYAKAYIDLSALIDQLHSLRFSVRLATVLIKGGIDNSGVFQEMVRFAKANGVDQLTLRPVNKPDVSRSRNDEVYQWTVENGLSAEDVTALEHHIESVGSPIMSLVHGARVFDVDGQNVCLTHSLTLDPTSDDLRQVIFFPNGRIAFDWAYEGAVLLGGSR